jgi:aminopeptidase-like protein
MEDMLRLYLEVIDWLDKDLVYDNPSPMCEPKLGERGLYDQTDMDVVLGLLFEADGKRPLSEISKKLGVTVPRASAVAGRLVELGLLEEEAVCHSG